MNRNRCLAFFLALSLAIFACNLPTSAPPTIPVGSPSSSSTPISNTPVVPTMTAGIAYQPIFEPAPCAFPVPSGYSPDCGYLIVPENRGRVGSPLIRLHVGIFRSDTQLKDPVVHLAGGPGSSSLAVAEYMFRQGLGAILNQRDFILFDQRGTGYSQPRLDCPERSSITGTLLEKGLASPDNYQIIIDAFRRCRDRLVGQGIDLTAYNSAASAADLNDLRIALGYDKLNLYAVSYGTRLALTLIRDHPEAVRSAVLDSVYPLQVNLYTTLAPNAEVAFNSFFANCSADPTCSSSYPDLRSVFYQLVDQLNIYPVSLMLYAGGAEHIVRLDGALLIDVLFVGLYNPAVTANMPKMIYDVSQGNYDILRERLTLYFDTSSALGMQMSVQCAEEIPFNTAEDAFIAAQGVSPPIASFYPVSVQPLFDICKEWTTATPDPRENLPVASLLPVLILMGDQDPITPLDWGKMVAEDLPRHFIYQFPGQGHWVTRSSSCALTVALAFWKDYTVDPIFACS